MKKPTSARQTNIMPGFWQRLIIFSVLIILMGNSLPSFLGQHEVITITGLPALTAQSQSQTLQRLYEPIKIS